MPEAHLPGQLDLLTGEVERPMDRATADRARALISQTLYALPAQHDQGLTVLELTRRTGLEAAQVKTMLGLLATEKAVQQSGRIVREKGMLARTWRTSDFIRDALHHIRREQL